MSEKRRDSRGRILRLGESQRKDGRYRYKYKDISGRERTVYSWRLVSTDKVPDGKRACTPLREKEIEIQRDAAAGISPDDSNITLCQLYERQNLSRSNVKRGTRINRRNLMDILSRDRLGARNISRITSCDAREWAVRMKENGYSYQTINNHKRSLKASFYIAIQEGYLKKNPFDFRLSDVVENDTKPRQPLTEKQENDLLDFVRVDDVYSKYYEAILLLLKTGLRASELCGLTINDLDFENRLLRVDHQLLRDKDAGYYVSPPKSRSGIRQIPMSGEVYTALHSVVARRKDPAGVQIDGHSGFLFLNQRGLPMTRAYYTSMFRHLITKYNKTHEEKLPPVSPHLLRHTFCTRLAEKNMNPKCLQYIMGHSDISITLNLYTHASVEGVKAEMAKLMT